MQLSDVFLNLGEDGFRQLLKSISIGKLKTFQLYERFKFRTHLAKLNTESVRTAAPRFWTRLVAHDEEFATDLSQAILVSRLDLIVDVLNFLGVPHEEGFFSKDLDPKEHLTEGWAGRVFEHFRAKYPEPLLLFYINHLGHELKSGEAMFAPVA